MSSISTIKYTPFIEVQKDSIHKNLARHANFASALQNALTEKPNQNSPEHLIALSLNINFDDISEQTKGYYYEQVLPNASARVDKSQSAKNQKIQLFEEAIIEIKDIAIKVDIEIDEVNEALLFSSLGIDFLKYKEAGVRTDMLSLLEKDVYQSKELTISEKHTLIDTISLERDKFALLQENILAGTYTSKEFTKKSIR
ncbi:hypothetical protein [Pseudoalteromonas luteoviolacea]|uniref:Uncharacterized protein n=1 Tax=Pseudoalteromonas luteoviolacea S4054 TaxID=1129367 RepID=A0A0F6AEB8_9GAMM|nr:hypothetical protein [Pseudoalteromonas luteoviolacea]AOT11186.1 hypothetical protein S4054249_25505 [Pseudoalteromonas luteoviolacea]AOT15650.1 hypothetical protein S40542_23005 [Pseudoalteromonas luteoviolacea]AOT21007.1 hypothetical protein S4054_25425 [Pseudoalteromonas luteoviolacea]KKE84535.1 hypothetical protein N479_08195 [Pseudoalteromonas luteoviolacea S4054]KZN71320.1 hypothetical protein N481_19225 [Pseudoalteromonas luteoviolacea S4047-1]